MAAPAPPNHHGAHRNGKTSRWSAGKPRTKVLVVAAVAILMTLCVGGGITAWVLIRTNEAGPTDPVTATDRFLTAVYTEQNATTVTSLTCPYARDKVAIKTKVTEITTALTALQDPVVSWQPPAVTSRTNDRAELAVTLDVLTADEKTATQKLTVTAVEDNGWWVCDISGG